MDDSRPGDGVLHPSLVACLGHFRDTRVSKGGKFGVLWGRFSMTRIGSISKVDSLISLSLSQFFIYYR